MGRANFTPALIAEHVHYVGALGLDGSAGADAIQAEVEKIKKIHGSGQIHLIGHSMGGAAVAEYLQRAMNRGQLDSKIASATLIDPWLPDRFPNARINRLGGWLGDQGANFKVFDTPEDGVGGCRGSSLYCEDNPDYSVDLNVKWAEALQGSCTKR